MFVKKVEITIKEAKLVVSLVESIHALGYTDDEAMVLKKKLKKLLEKG